MLLAAPTPEALPLAQALIRCPSVTPADAGVMAILRQAAQSAGFVVQTFVAGEPGGPQVQNFYAQMGSGRPDLAFVGHVDVVPTGPEEAWTHPPFAAQVHNGSLYGRGSADMKGAIAAFVVAAQRFAQAHRPLPGSIGMLITGDEEVGSPQGMRALLAWCQKHQCLPKVGLIGEASNVGSMGQGLRVGRRGSLNVHVSVTGVMGHVAYPERARNPVHPLVAYLAAVQAHDFGAAVDIFPATSLQITQVHVDNTATNVIPAQARAHFNIRFNTRHRGATLSAQLQAMAAAISPHLHLAIGISGEPYRCTAPQLVAATAAAVRQVTGREPEQNAGGGVSDGRFLFPHCPVLECGLVGDSIHQVDEHVPLAHLDQLTQIYQHTLHNYFATAAQPAAPSGG